MRMNLILVAHILVALVSAHTVLGTTPTVRPLTQRQQHSGRLCTMRMNLILVAHILVALVSSHTVLGTTPTVRPLTQRQQHSDTTKSANINYTCPYNCELCTVNGSCRTCSPGWFGDKCSQPCHSNCYNCSESGECDMCNSSGFYGPLCRQPCDLCNGGACNRSRCIRGCVDGYLEAPLLEVHIPGALDYYECVECPAVCTSCSEGRCNSCIHRRWGEKCTKRCRVCLSHSLQDLSCKLCDRHTGKCLDDCGSGRYRDAAGQCPEFCSSCSSESKCTGCVGQRYGETCEHVNCSSIPNCVLCECSILQCAMDDIICTKCDNGYNGVKCQMNNTVEVANLKEANTSQPTSTSHYCHESLSEDEDTGMGTVSKVGISVGVIFVVAIAAAFYWFLIARRSSCCTPCSRLRRQFRKSKRRDSVEDTPLNQSTSSTKSINSQR